MTVHIRRTTKHRRSPDKVALERRIMDLLVGGPATTTELIAALDVEGALLKSSVDHLRRAGAIEMTDEEKDGARLLRLERVVDTTFKSWAGGRRRGRDVPAPPVTPRPRPKKANPPATTTTPPRIPPPREQVTVIPLFLSVARVERIKATYVRGEVTA